MAAVLSFPIEAQVREHALPSSGPGVTAEAKTDFVSIRGVRLPIAELVDRSLFTPENRDRLNKQLLAALPFPHLVIDGIFNPMLLELIAEEFDMRPEAAWNEVKTKYESTRRSVLGATLAPATQLYFDIVHSGWFSNWLSSLSGAQYLLADPKLFGGGLHESKPGAVFAVHRDFNRHPEIGLKNEMVFITYLNKGWQPEWGSALELWDKKADQCVTMVQPEFGRTILLPHGPASYHGHTKPLQTPDGRTRRSIAAYFYTSPLAGKRNGDQSSSVFMRQDRLDRIKYFARMATPPAVWLLAQKLSGR